MKREKNAFTLVELLAVIVILGITFMFILPSLTGLVSNGNKTEKELIEERIISAAKEYVNNIDGTFFTQLYKEGDVNYINVSDLVNAGLIDEKELSNLGSVVRVKGEVLENYKIKYTIEKRNKSY